MRRDVRKRRYAEAEQNRLLAILEASRDYIGIADLTGKLIYANRTWRLRFGIKEDQNLSQDHIINIHPEWVGKLIIEEAIPIAKKEGAWLGETAFLDPQGGEIPVSP